MKIQLHLIIAQGPFNNIDLEHTIMTMDRANLIAYKVIFPYFTEK